MGRQGYKGIAPIGGNLYVINDDGDHVIKLIEIISRNHCNVMVVAGQVGIEGTLDHHIGRKALLSRPGR
jgi:hypothetical protein